MIVISGALVLVALVLLVIGLIDPSLGFVYASIAVSLASFVFLVIGILQRRKEVVPGVADAPASTEGLTAVIPSLAAEPVTTTRTAVAPVADGVSGQVLVVAGRPRYHVEGCRYLAGKDPESVDVAVARADSFTACGVCKPDESLSAAPAEPVLEDVSDDVEQEETEPVLLKAEPVRATRKVAAPTSRIAAPAAKPLSKDLRPRKPAAKAPATVTAPAKKAAPAKVTAPVKTTAPAKVTAPAKKAAPAKAAAPVKKAAAKAPAKAAAPVKKAAAKAPAKAAAPAKKAAAPVKKAAAPAKKAPAKKTAAKR